MTKKIRNTFLSAFAVSAMVLSLSGCSNSSRINPVAISLNNKAVEVMVETQDFAQMNELLDSALMIQPDYDVAMRNKMTALINLGRLSEVETLLSKMKVISPDDDNVLIGLGMYYDYCGDTIKAITYYDEAEKRILQSVKKRKGKELFPLYSSLWVVRFLKNESIKLDSTEELMSNYSVDDYSRMKLFLDELRIRGKRRFIHETFSPAYLTE